MCEALYDIKIVPSVLEAISYGAREPDNFSFGGLQMLLQRVEPGSYGKKRDVSALRIAAQSLHASPSPTRAPYSDSVSDQSLLKETIRRPESELLPDRLDLQLYAYDNNQAVRNKILVNASQYLCTSFAQRNQRQAGRKFGNMLHMLGDTYSASHVQRSPPVGDPQNCGTEKIEWHFSMDLVSWKQHRPADLEYEDWRFHCLEQHTAKLLQLWSGGRGETQRASDRKAKLKTANAQLRQSLNYLCSKVLREDPEILSQPAGGAPAGYSSASGTDLWNLLGPGKRDRPIQPLGLTGVREAEAFATTLNERLIASGSQARFWYPSRHERDYCLGIAGRAPLPKALQCTAQEIDWAMENSASIATMWIPPRGQQ